jgi:hypothetical protein
MAAGVADSKKPIASATDDAETALAKIEGDVAFIAGYIKGGKSKLVSDVVDIVGRESHS